MSSLCGLGMSLLECLGCPGHCRDRVAVTCSDPSLCSTVDTYSHLVDRACQIGCYLRRKLLPSASQAVSSCLGLPIGVYGGSNPEVISCLLGIMAVPAVYIPVDLQLPAGSKVEVLKALGAAAVLVHLTALKHFLWQDWQSTGTVFQFDTTLLQLGFIIASPQPQWHRDLVTPPPTHPGEVHPNLEPIPPSKGSSGQTSCTGVTMCGPCERISSRISHELPQQDGGLARALAAYQSEVHPLVCPMCLVDSSSPSTTPFTIASTCARWPFPVVPLHALAYVLHTSGTTGLPKCVRVPHCCVVPNVTDLRRRFSIDMDDVIFNAAPLTFDPSIVEVFLALSSGAAILVVPDMIKRSPVHLAVVLFHRHPVTVMQVTPALVYRLPEGEVRECLLGEGSRVRVLAFGGENCPGLGLLTKWKHPQNRTSVFNIYGTTEVSSWATCYSIPDYAFKEAVQQRIQLRETMGVLPSQVRERIGEESAVANHIPIGGPMLGTSLEVRDRDGSSITTGFGEIWIGGIYRVCLLEGEAAISPGTMRSTGDWGYVDAAGRVYWVGRGDRQIKRLGHRINLDSIQQTIQEHGDISACVVAPLSQQSPLVKLLHLHPTPLQDLLIAFAVPSAKAAEELDTTGATQSLALRVKSSFLTLLPSYCVPDDVVLVKYLPMTEHGKVDLKLLLNGNHPELFLTDRSNTLPPPPSLVSSRALPFPQLKEMLQSVAFQMAGVEDWPDDRCILEVGGNSFDVVRISNHFERELEKAVGHLPPAITELVDQLLARTLREVTSYLLESVCSVGAAPSSMETPPEMASLKKRVRGSAGSGGLVEKRSRKKLRVLPGGDEAHRCTAWTRGLRFTNGRLQPYAMDTETISRHRTISSTTPRTTVCCRFQQKWSVSTGKCVDASPLVVQGPGSVPVVYLGSHSGVFLAVEVLSGTVKWQKQLGSRIIGSACVSRCGRYIVVGTHGGCIYTLRADSGEVHWCFQTPSREPCNSSPCVDPETGLVWIGSHDQNVYCLDIQEKTALHQVFVLGGSCYASPCIDSEMRVLYCATLQGKLVAVDMDTAGVDLVFRCPQPIFSSPSLLPNRGVVVGCVDGSVYVLDKQRALVGKLCTNNSVFSSPCVAVMSPTSHEGAREEGAVVSPTSHEGAREEGAVAEKWRIFCGSHDKCVYSWNAQLELVWKVELDSEVFSVPCLCHMPLHGHLPESIPSHRVGSSSDGVLPEMPTMAYEHTTQSTTLCCVCVCSTAGTIYLLDPATGTILGLHKLPSNVFSSPISPVDGHIVVGCRDDNIYCIRCTVVRGN